MDIPQFNPRCHLCQGDSLVLPPTINKFLSAKDATGPHYSQPETPSPNTHFICRVRLRCGGVLLLTGMW